MTVPKDIYTQEKNSDELSRIFHDKAGDIAKDLNKQLLTLSTGIIAAFFFVIFNKLNELIILEKVIILITIILFGFSILYIILSMQWDASKYFYLGHINDSTKQDERERNAQLKINFQKKQRSAKNAARIFFLLGVLLSITFIAIFTLL